MLQNHILTLSFHPRKGKAMVEQQLPSIAINYLFVARNTDFKQRN